MFFICQQCQRQRNLSKQANPEVSLTLTTLTRPKQKRKPTMMIGAKYADPPPIVQPNWPAWGVRDWKPMATVCDSLPSISSRRKFSPTCERTSPRSWIICEPAKSSWMPNRDRGRCAFGSRNCQSVSHREIRWCTLETFRNLFRKDKRKMASLSTDNGGGRRIQFLSPTDGKRKAIRLGRLPKKAADTVRIRVEFLVNAQAMGTPIDPETAAWVTNLGTDLATSWPVRGWWKRTNERE